MINGSKPIEVNIVQEKEFTAAASGTNRDQLLVARNHTISSFEEFKKAEMINEESVKDVGSFDELVSNLGIDKESETYESDERLNEGQKARSRHTKD